MSEPMCDECKVALHYRRARRQTQTEPAEPAAVYCPSCGDEWEWGERDDYDELIEGVWCWRHD